MNSELGQPRTVGYDLVRMAMTIGVMNAMKWHGTFSNFEKHI